MVFNLKFKGDLENQFHYMNKKINIDNNSNNDDNNNNNNR